MLLFGDNLRGHAYQRVETVVSEKLASRTFPGGNLSSLMISGVADGILHLFRQSKLYVLLWFEKLLMCKVIHLSSHSSVSLDGVATHITCSRMFCCPCTGGIKEGELQISGASVEKNGFCTHRFQLGRNTEDFGFVSPYLNE